MTRSLWCTWTKRSFGKDPILHGVSPVSQNLYVESLNQFHIFLAKKYASFGHSAYFRNPFGKLSHLRAKYGKSPQNFLSIFTLRQHKFSPNVLIWSKYLSIMETTGWYLSIDMCFVLVHCCVGMLMTSCLWGATPILGRKRITLLQPEATGSWSPSPLIVSWDSFSLWTWARVQTARSTACFNGCPYSIFLVYYYIAIYVFVPHFFYLSALVGCWSSVSKRRIIYTFLNVCPFDYTAVAVSGKVEPS